MHPPLTDIPIGAYMLVAAFDVASYAGQSQGWAREVYRPGTFVIIAGAVVSLLAAFTGWWDWRHSTESGTQARRTANAHAWTMLSVTALVLADIALRTLDDEWQDAGRHHRSAPAEPQPVEGDAEAQGGARNQQPPQHAQRLRPGEGDHVLGPRRHR